MSVSLLHCCYHRIFSTLLFCFSTNSIEATSDFVCRTELQNYFTRILEDNLKVADMKAEYIPPREDIIMQNKSPGNLYIIVSREVEMIESKMKNEQTVWTSKSGDMVGEVRAFCCRQHVSNQQTFVALEDQNE